MDIAALAEPKQQKGRSGHEHGHEQGWLQHYHLGESLDATEKEGGMDG